MVSLGSLLRSPGGFGGLLGVSRRSREESSGGLLGDLLVVSS